MSDCESMIYTIADKVSEKLSPETLAWFYRKMPVEMARRMALHRFRATVRWAGERSAFYRRVFKERGIDPRKVRTPADLGDFYTTPDDLVANATEFICRPASIVFESSGTSGKNKQVYYDDAELKEIGRTMAGGFRLMGIGREDRVANGFDFSIWIPGMLAHYALMASGNFCLAFGKVDPVEVYRRLKQYEFNVVMGEPTWLIRLTQMAEKDGGGKLKMLVGGAEEMPAEAIDWMSRVWGGAKVKMAYASVEMANALAFQPCDVAGGYHIDHFDFLPEILEPDEEGYGEMVFTTLRRRVTPLIRYRTRDVTKIVGEKCACGLPAPRMTKLRGRRDELVVASGGNLYPLMFENILKEVEGLEHDFQVVFTLEGVREVLTINVETRRTDREAVEQEIHQRATDLYPDLMKNLGIGIFEMRVTFHEPGTIRVKRKLKRMVDRRHFVAKEEAEELVAVGNGR